MSKPDTLGASHVLPVMMIPFNVLGFVRLCFFDAAVSVILWQEACFLVL